ncbi:copper oxidase [Corynebacterium phocae]|nr:copper oxidase [Corynebacterium phocae]
MMYWMLAFIVAGLTHFVIPNYPWVLIHIFTLGVLTNSILIWSQHLTEKFVQQRLDDSTRPAQLFRIYGVNVGALITVCGNMFTIAPVTIIGAVIVAALMLWHSAFLFSQWRNARGKRFRSIVAAYTASAALLPCGAFFGGLLALDPGNPRLIIAHVACNVGGFVGLAAAASLTVLFPAVWRASGITRFMTPALALLAVGVVATAGGALLGVPEAGLVIYTAGWILNWQQWLGNVHAKGVNYPSVSVLAAVTWLVLTLTYYTVTLLTQVEPKLPTIALLVGFAGQLLIGVMAYLLPTTVGGGPAAVRAGLQAMGRWGLLRATFINGGLLLWITGQDSYLKVVMSLLCLAPLAVFPVFMVRGVKAQRAVLTKQAAGPAEVAANPHEVLVGAGILAVLWALFHIF